MSEYDMTTLDDFSTEDILEHLEWRLNVKYPDVSNIQTLQKFELLMEAMEKFSLHELELKLK